MAGRRRQAPGVPRQARPRAGQVLSAIELTVTVAASRAATCECFTDPFAMVRWMGVDALVDPTAGGELRVEVNGRDVVVGEFVEVEPPDHVQFTWGWEGSTEVPPGSSTVDVTFTAGDGADDDGAARTLVTLRHAGLPAAEVARHAERWQHSLARLAVVAAGGDPGRDPWLDATA